MPNVSTGELVAPGVPPDARLPLCSPSVSMFTLKCGARLWSALVEWGLLPRGSRDGAGGTAPGKDGDASVLLQVVWVDVAWTGEARTPLGTVRGWDRRVCGGFSTSLRVHGPSRFLSIAPTLTEEHGKGERLS